MAIQNEPTRIQIPFADSGTKNVIPDTNPTPSASQAASWTDGFPSQCSLPLSAGGIPPARADFNGIFNTMSQSIRFGQEGGVWTWDATVDYATNRLVLGSDGLLYWSVAQSGPNVGGAQDPTTDDGTYWASPSVKTMDSLDSSSAAASTAFVESRVGTLILPTEWYLDSVNGNDSNSGLSAGDALKTYSGFASRILEYPIKMTGAVLSVYVAAGTYSGLDIPYGFFGHVTYVFASGSQFDGIHLVRDGSRIMLTGGPCVSTGMIRADCQTAIWLNQGLSLTFSGISSNSCLLASRNAVININSSSSQPVSISFSSCKVSNGVFQADANGTIFIVSAANTRFSGTPTGPRYSATHGGVIAGMGSTTKIPGTTNGTVDSSSSYS